MMRLPLAALAAFALAGAAHANLIVMLGSTTGGSAGMVVGPINTDLPEIVGLDTVGSTLTVKPGAWDGSASTKTYSWHMIGGASLGTGMTFGPLTSAMVSACASGTDTTCGRLQVDEIATNAAGASTAISDYVGPVETALPSNPPPIGAGPPPTSWPGPPANYLENGWPVYPGCDVPPVSPDTSDPTKVWYFDPAGQTQAAGATGHAGSPFQNVTAVFGAIVGYNPGVVTTVILQNHTSGPGGNQDLVQLRGTFASGGIATVDGILATLPPGTPSLGTNIGSIIVPLGHTATAANTSVYTPLWPSVIGPGSVIYVKGDPSGASVGSLNGSAYSTSDGTATGTVPGFWTWFLADPASTVPPVLTSVSLTSSAGFLVDGLKVEQNALTTSTFATPGLTLVSVGGNIAAPAFDVYLRHISVDSYPGHSSDPQNPSGYPTTGGHADGTMATASPYWGPGDGNVAGAITISASAAGQTKLFLSTPPPNLSFVAGGQFYIFSPGYFMQQEENNLGLVTAPSNTGIPNGTIIVDLQGSTALTNKGQLTAATATELSGGTTPTGFVNQTTAAALGGATIAGTVASSGALPAAGGGVFTLNSAVVATALVSGHTYTIASVADTDWVAVGAASNTAGVVFTATGAGTGKGTAGAFLASQGTGGVTIGGVAVASITSWSATQIVGVLPIAALAPTTANTVVALNGGSLTAAASSIALTKQFYVVQTSTTDPQSLYQWCVAPTVTTCPTTSLWGLVGTFLPVTGTAPEYYSVQPLTAGVRSTFSTLYSWSGTAWASVGTFLPAVATLNDDWYMLNTSHLFTGDAAPSWIDGGQTFIDIGACDTTINGSTGCKTVPLGCDPKAGGDCPSGTSPAWNGTTRAITSEGTFFSPRIQIIPSGWWNHQDWDYALNGVYFTGTINSSSGNPDPANPNNIQGAYCLSISKSSIRWVRNQFGWNATQDSIAYNNFMKYRSGDAVKRYSSHRTMNIRNFSADSSWQGRDHPDCVQDAQSQGPAASHWYSNVDMDMECYTSVDPLDPFVNYTEGIFGTDQIYDGSYKANNVLVSSNPSGPLGTTGMWDVVADNDALTDDALSPGGIRELSGSKAGGGLPAHSLIANNLTQAFVRNNPFPTQPCENSTTTAENNISLPTVNWSTGLLGIGNSTHCNTNDLMFNASAAGQYPDLSVWLPYDWRTAISGANSPFNDMHTNAPPALPGGGAGQMGSNSCLRNEWPIGTCNPGDVGRMDLRPSASFVPSTGTIKGNVKDAGNLPSSGVTVGDAYVAQAVAVCASFQVTCTTGVTYPPGVYTYVGPGVADWTPQPPNHPVPYNPAIIGGGLNLGAQMPPTDHARRPWKATPAVGAYEGP